MGIAVDNWAALVIDGDTYELVTREGHQGSVGPDGKFTSDYSIGSPGAWSLRIQKDGSLSRKRVPSNGTVASLLKAPRYSTEPELLKVARLQTPDDGKPPALIRPAKWDDESF